MKSAGRNKGISGETAMSTTRQTILASRPAALVLALSLVGWFSRYHWWAGFPHRL